MPKLQIVGSIIALIMLLTRVCTNWDVQNQAQKKDLYELKKLVSREVVFDATDDTGGIISKFTNLKQRTNKVLECDEKSLSELDTIKQELYNLVGKEQCLLEAVSAAEELVLQKNANRSMGEVIKKTEAENKKLKDAANKRVQNEGVMLGLILKEVKELREEKAVLQEVIRKLEEEKSELVVEQRKLADQVYLERKKAEEGRSIIRQCHDSINHDTIAYNFLEAEKNMHAHRGNYYKGLCGEASTITPDREAHHMGMEDKEEHSELGMRRTLLDEKYDGYVRARAALEEYRADIKRGTPQIIKEEQEDPNVLRAIELSQEDMKRNQCADSSQMLQEDPDLLRAIELSKLK